MHRVTDSAKREIIVAALQLLPETVRSISEFTDLFTEDAIFAAIARPGVHETYDTGDGRSFRDTAHVIYAPWTRSGNPTIVAPRYEPESRFQVSDAVHEWGHVLHSCLPGTYLHDVPVVTEWAEKSPGEAFAEWVCAWTCEDWSDVRERAQADERSRALWDAICRGDWELVGRMADS